MLGAVVTLASFVVLRFVLARPFGVSRQAAALGAIGFGWAFVALSDSVRSAVAFGCVVLGAYFGFRVMPRLVLAGLGFPPEWASDHIRFHDLAEQAGRVRRAPTSLAGMDTAMHLGTLRMYTNAIRWSLVATGCQLFSLEILPLGITCVQILLTSYPLGLLFKRWLAITFQRFEEIR